MRSRFDETKVKMVMKLKKLTRRAAVKEIARMEAAKRKATEEEAAREVAEQARMRARIEEKREELRRRRGQAANISRGIVSAEEFFGTGR